MNAPLTDALDDLAGAPPGVDPTTVRVRGDRLAAIRRRRRVALTSVAAVAVIVLIGGLLSRDDSQRLDVGPAGSDSTVGSEQSSAPTTRGSLTGDASPPPAVLAGDTGIVVVGDDGLGGAVVIDLDDRQVVRRVVEGSGAGDQPHRFDLIDGTIITGWGEIWGTDVRTATSRKITDGTIYLPGSDGTIWIADWTGGRIGAGTLTYAKVGVDGGVIERVVDPRAFTSPGASGSAATPYASPSWGLGPYLLHDTAHGVAAWDPTTDSIAWRAGSDGGSGRVVDARAGRALWTGDDATLHVLDEQGTDTVLSVEVPPAAHISSARLAPDGTRVALTIATDSAGLTTSSLRIVDVGSGQVADIAGELVTPEFATGPVQWSPDGTQILSIGWSYASGTTTVARYVLGHDAWTWETLPFGGVTASTLIERADASVWLDAADTTPDGCPPLTGYSSGQDRSPCAFAF